MATLCARTRARDRDTDRDRYRDRDTDRDRYRDRAKAIRLADPSSMAGLAADIRSSSKALGGLDPCSRL